MKQILFKFFSILLLLVALSACGGSIPGGDGLNPNQDGGGGGGRGGDGLHPLTPTPPVPTFGNFILGSAASQPSSAASQSSSMSAGTAKKGLLGLPINIQLPKIPDLLDGILGILNGDIRIHETRNVIAEISFKPDNGAQNVIQFPDTHVLKLISQGTPFNQEFPDFGVTTLPFDTYHEVELRFEILTTGLIPPELLSDPLVSSLLVSNTILVHGSFLELPLLDLDLNGLVNFIQFLIVVDDPINIRITSPNAFTVSPDQINYFFLAFRVEDWFEGILGKLQNLSITDLVDGVIEITHLNPNPLVQEILDLFRQNVENSIKFAPSGDAVFDEADVDEASSSVPF